MPICFSRGVNRNARRILIIPAEIIIFEKAPFILNVSIVCIPNTLLSDTINGRKARIRNTGMLPSYAVPKIIRTIGAAKIKRTAENIKDPLPNKIRIFRKKVNVCIFDLWVSLLM